MAQLVEVTPDESAAAIRSKLAAAPEREVILVVPRGTKSLQSPVGARLLARLAFDQHMRLALVTRDSDVRQHAEDAGLSVFGQVSGAQHAKRWRSPRDARAPSFRRFVRPKITRTPRPRARSWPERVFGVLLLLLLLFAIGAGSALLLPEGAVEVRPGRQALGVEVRMAVQAGLKDVDYNAVAIPGRAITTIVQGTWSQSTTARMDAADLRARGRVLFINQQGTPITLPSGSIVSTGAGVPVRFRTLAEAQLAGQRGATAEVEVEAVDPGPQGNVGAYLINTLQGPLATHVGVINEQPTQGGSVRQVAVVGDQDLERLRTGLLQRLESEAHAAMQGQLSEGEFAPRETLQRTNVFGEGHDRMVGEVADNVTYTLRAEYEEIAFKGIDANRIALAGLQGAVPEGYKLTDEGLAFEITGVQVDESRNLFLTAVARGVATAILDSGEIRSLVAGLTPEEAQQRLTEELHLAEPAVVRVSPSWLGQLPRFGFRVRVTIGG